MTGFFEPVPEPPKPERHRRPEWLGPPDNVLGAPVPLVVVLAKTEDLAAVVAHPTAYPSGFAFRLQVAGANGGRRLRPLHVPPAPRRSG